MSFFQRIKKGFVPQSPAQPTDTSFVFPYAEDPAIRRQQVWQNLEKGILFEDTGVLLSWQTPFSALDNLAEQRRELGDRTNWFLGNHSILAGYRCQVGVMKWAFVNLSTPINRIEEWLGHDQEGNQKFLALKNHLTNLLGEPTSTNLETFGDFEVGSVEWKTPNLTISLTGIEQVVYKYRLYISFTAG